MTTTAEEAEHYYLISMEAENVKTLRLVRIDPEGQPVFTIGGMNGAGKTSLLDCLRMSLMGGREIPKDPIRHGERHASVKTVLGRDGKPALTIELEMQIANKPRLIVRDASGNPRATPQAVLNELWEHVAFDPLEFSRFDKEKKTEIIMRLAKLDFSAERALEEAAFEARKTATRELKDLDSRFRMLPGHSGVPKEETSIVEIVRELSAANAHNGARVAAAAQLGTAKTRVSQAEAEIVDLEAQLGQARAKAVTRSAELALAEQHLASLAPAQDIEALQLRAASAEDTNKKVRENATRAALEVEIRAKERLAAKHDAAITAAQEAQKALIAAAKFPVPELTYDLKLGLLFRDSPLEEASDGQKLKLSVAIAIALNPKLRLMLIKQGNLLDPSARSMIRAMAEEAGAQVLMELVSETPAGCSVFLEDGELKETAASAAE